MWAHFYENLLRQPFRPLVNRAAVTAVNTTLTQLESAPGICFRSPLAGSRRAIPFLHPVVNY